MKSKALKPFMTKRLALAQFCSTVRGKGVLALCQALCTLVPSGAHVRRALLHSMLPVRHAKMLQPFWNGKLGKHIVNPEQLEFLRDRFAAIRRAVHCDNEVRRWKVPDEIFATIFRHFPESR